MGETMTKKVIEKLVEQINDLKSQLDEKKELIERLKKMCRGERRNGTENWKAFMEAKTELKHCNEKIKKLEEELKFWRCKIY